MKSSYLSKNNLIHPWTIDTKLEVLDPNCQSFSYNSSVVWRIFLLLFWTALAYFFADILLASEVPTYKGLGLLGIAYYAFRIPNLFRKHFVYLDHEKVLIPKSSLSMRHHQVRFNEVINLEVIDGEQLVIERNDGKFLLISEYIIGKENFCLVMSSLYENLGKGKKAQPEGFKAVWFRLSPWLPVASTFIILYYLTSFIDS